MDRIVYGLAPSTRNDRLPPESMASVFSMEPSAGLLRATLDLQPGKYLLNVSASDGKFVAYAPFVVDVRSVTEEMLESSVSVQFAGVDSKTFLAQYEERFASALV